MPADDLTRRGYQMEMQRYQENLRRALNEVRLTLDSLTRHLDSDAAATVAGESRRLLAAAGDTVQAAGALYAAEQLSFGFDGKP